MVGFEIKEGATVPGNRCFALIAIRYEDAGQISDPSRKILSASRNDHVWRGWGVIASVVIALRVAASAAVRKLG